MGLRRDSLQAFVSSHACNALPCRSIGRWTQNHNNHVLSYTHTLARAEWGETAEETARKGRRFVVGFAVRMELGRLPTYLMFCELPKDKGKRKAVENTR